MSGVPAMWLDAERLGDHVHVVVRTGRQYGQEIPNYDNEEGSHNDAGGAGHLILRVDQWQPLIASLAVGGHETGLRVIWRYMPDDRRYLWNGAPDAPCVVGTTDPVTWDRQPLGEHPGSNVTSKTPLVQPPKAGPSVFGGD